MFIPRPVFDNISPKNTETSSKTTLFDLQDSFSIVFESLTEFSAHEADFREVK